MRFPSVGSYAASSKRIIFLASCILPTFFLAFFLLRPSTTSSTRPTGPPTTFDHFDTSPYTFDAASDEHQAFCKSLSSLQGFKDALGEDFLAEEGKEVEESSSKTPSPSSKPLARSISPTILLESLALRMASPKTPPHDPMQHDHPSLPFSYPSHHSVPHLIHQSWKTHDPPPLYAPMIQSWKETYPEAQIVLWNDTDNRRLVEIGYPKLLPVYNALGSEIYRADLIRNLYMHAFGGIYSDLDSQAYHSLFPLFEQLSPVTTTLDPIAFLGRMETYTYATHGIPNAFFASSPGHPFWLEGPVQRAVVAFEEGRIKTADPEHLTGPVALLESEKWWNEWHGSGKKGKVVVLDKSVAYPYSWDWRSEMQECVCWARSPFFNTKMCHALMPDAYVISFWKHSW